MEKQTITYAEGNGIGPEIMSSVMDILEAAGAPIAYEEIEIGEAVYKRGVAAGIEESAWQSLRRTKVFLKAPITTPQGGGFKSLNVTVRTSLGLFANVRPCVAYHPFVETKHPDMDVVIVRENEEDLYSGIEYRSTKQVYRSIKLISEPGCERIVRYAFEYAKNNGRKKVTCFVKDNIMKMSDGIFHKVFDRVAAEYPEIKSDHFIVDIGAALLADQPERFDVIVMPNLYGDILSDVAAQIAGSIGLAGTANIGKNVAMFEAIHGSAPDIAGKDIANPSGLLLSAVMMLVHLGLGDHATKIHNAWLTTLEHGIHTKDIYQPKTSKKLVGTKEFTKTVIENLGKLPTTFKAVSYVNKKAAAQDLPEKGSKYSIQEKTLVGIDIFVDKSTADVNALVSSLEGFNTATLSLSMITNRGVKVWPGGQPETSLADYWRCRFISKDKQKIGSSEISDLYAKLLTAGHDVTEAVTLYLFDTDLGFSVGQGE